MKKNHHFTELSYIKCSHPGCRRKLKLNLVKRKPTAKFCFKHYWLNRITKPMKGKGSTDKTPWNMRAAGLKERK